MLTERCTLHTSNHPRAQLDASHVRETLLVTEYMRVTQRFDHVIDQFKLERIVACMSQGFSQTSL